jgi:hypothetical protein
VVEVLKQLLAVDGATAFRALLAGEVFDASAHGVGDVSASGHGEKSGRCARTNRPQRARQRLRWDNTL